MLPPSLSEITTKVSRSCYAPMQHLIVRHIPSDLPEAVKKRVGVLPDGYLNYFTARFPALFTHVHQVIYDSKLRHESQFAPYFILDEST